MAWRREILDITTKLVNEFDYAVSVFPKKKKTIYQTNRHAKLLARH